MRSHFSGQEPGKDKTSPEEQYTHAALLCMHEDYERALHWFTKAAEQGHADAQYSLARLYQMGRGVEQDHAQAAHWYRQAAEQGVSNAQTALGRCYELGIGVEKDDRQAAYWLELAAQMKEGF